MKVLRRIAEASIHLAMIAYALFFFGVIIAVIVRVLKTP